MGCRELCGGVHTDTYTDTEAIGFQTHCVGVGASVGKGKICVGVGQCEHTINVISYKNTAECGYTSSPFPVWA